VDVALWDLKALEWFHGHVRIENLLFSGVLDPSGGALHPGADGAPGHGLALRTGAADRYRES
jgi:hypothetical protein